MQLVFHTKGCFRPLCLLTLAKLKDGQHGKGRLFTSPHHVPSLFTFPRYQRRVRLVVSVGAFGQYPAGTMKKWKKWVFHGARIQSWSVNRMKSDSGGGRVQYLEPPWACIERESKHKYPQGVAGRLQEIQESMRKETLSWGSQQSSGRAAKQSKLCRRKKETRFLSNF